MYETDMVEQYSLLKRLRNRHSPLIDLRQAAWLQPFCSRSIPPRANCDSAALTFIPSPTLTPLLPSLRRKHFEFFDFFSLRIRNGRFLQKGSYSSTHRICWRRTTGRILLGTYCCRGRAYTHRLHLCHEQLAKRSGCSGTSFYTAPTQGQTINSAKPVDFSWDTKCLSPAPQYVDLYLYAPTKNSSMIQAFSQADYAHGSLQVHLLR